MTSAWSSDVTCPKTASQWRLVSCSEQLSSRLPEAAERPRTRLRTPAKTQATMAKRSRPKDWQLYQKGSILEREKALGRLSGGSGGSPARHSPRGARGFGARLARAPTLRLRRPHRRRDRVLRGDPGV